MSQRHLSQSQFGNNVTINQGDIHYNAPRQPQPPRVDGPAYVIPYPRNEDVICRPDLVKRLDQLLPRETQPNSAALWGLGGSGKTQIALDYAYRRCEGKVSSVFWVHADSKATFIHDYKTIASKICVDQTADGEDLLRAVRNGIEALPSWVLILDNADNLELFGVGLPVDEGKRGLDEFVPIGPTGTVLWTSRDARIAGSLVGSRRGIEVTSMKSDEAMELLESTMGREIEPEEHEDATALLVELEWFPLAISQAGAYMRRMTITTSRYLSLLGESKRRWETLKSTEFDRHRKPGMRNSVFDTWTVSMERIQSENKMAYQVLHIVAYLDNQNLSRELIIKITRCGNGRTGKEPEELEVMSAITRLQEFSFLKMRRIDDGDPSYEMHKLVQEAARHRLIMRETSQMSPAQGTLVQPESDDGAYYSGVALEALLDLFPTSKPETWQRCERYLAHAIGLSDWAEVSKRETEITELLSKVSGYLYDRGRWREKEPVDQRALELRRKVLGERHPQTLESIASLASAYHYQGQHDKAKACYKEAMELRQLTLGERHPDTLWAMVKLGQVYQSHGQYKEAETLYKKVLVIQQEVLGERHPDTIQTLASISAAYHYQGHYDKARPIKKKTLDLQREVLGEKHPLTLWNLGSLASTYQCLGQYEEARALFHETLDLRRETLGERHPDTLRSITQLGSLYYDLREYEKAAALAEEAMSLEQEILGEQHPYTLQAMHNLAVAQRMCGKRDEALYNIRRCVQGRRTVLGSEHPFTRDSVEVLEKWESEERGSGRVGKLSKIRRMRIWGCLC